MQLRCWQQLSLYLLVLKYVNCSHQRSQSPRSISRRIIKKKQQVEQQRVPDYAVSHHNYFLVSPEFIIAYRKLIRSQLHAHFIRGP